MRRINLPEKEIKAVYAKWKSIAAVAKKFNVHHAVIRRVLGITARQKYSHPALESTKTISSAQSIDVLLAAHDDVAKLKNAITKLTREQFVSDEDFRRELRVSPERWRIITAENKFSKNRYELPNHKVVWIHTSMRRVLDSKIKLVPLTGDSL
jgi:transposase